MIAFLIIVCVLQYLFICWFHCYLLEIHDFASINRADAMIVFLWPLHWLRMLAEQVYWKVQNNYRLRKNYRRRYKKQLRIIYKKPVA